MLPWALFSRDCTHTLHTLLPSAGTLQYCLAAKWMAVLTLLFLRGTHMLHMLLP